jgi:HSP20 family molecular chaperone IbpA
MVPEGEDGLFRGEYSGAQIQFAVAGFEEEDIKIYFEGRTLVIEGDNLKHDNVSAKFKCSFNRKISIRENLDLEKADISLKNGILNIVLPVKDPKKNRTYILGGKD